VDSPLSVENPLQFHAPNQTFDENQTNTDNNESSSPQPSVDRSQLSLNPTARLLSLGTVAVSTVLTSDSAKSKQKLFPWYLPKFGSHSYDFT